MTQRIESLDLTGLKCPQLAIATKRRLSQMSEGGLLAVATTDPMAAIDLAAMTTDHGHVVEHVVETEVGHLITIRVGDGGGGAGKWPFLDAQSDGPLLDRAEPDSST